MRAASTRRLLSRVSISTPIPPRFYNARDVVVREDAVSEEEEASLVRDVDEAVMPKSRVYESSHFDQVILHYRETQIRNLDALSPTSREALRRVMAALREAFPETSEWMAPHVIDLKPGVGRIDRHVDSVKYGGAIVSGLSLLAHRVMRLTDEPPPSPSTVPAFVDVSLPRRSLYWIKDDARYKMAHAISSGPERRVSLIFRDEPPPPAWTLARGGIEGRRRRRR